MTKSKQVRLQKTASIMITGAMRTTPRKGLEMFLDLSPFGTVVEVAVLAVAYHLPRPNPTIPETRHNRMWVKVDEVDASTIQYMDRRSCISPIEFLHVKT